MSLRYFPTVVLSRIQVGFGPDKWCFQAGGKNIVKKFTIPVARAKGVW